MPLVIFMRGTSGRLLRIVAGLSIIAVGLLVVGGTSGPVVAAAGLVPLLAGATGVCLFGPIFGADLRGRPTGGSA